MSDKNKFMKADWAALSEITATQMDTPTNSYVDGKLVDINERIIEIDPIKCEPLTLEELQKLQKCKETISIHRII